jgi:hypothetical protein
LAAPAADAQIESRIPIAVFAVPADADSLDAAALIEQAMEENVGAYRGFRLVPAESVLDRAAWDRVEKARTEARVNLAKGRTLYENLDLGEAVKRLSAARQSHERHMLFGGAQKDHMDALAYLGASHILQGSESAGTEVFRRMVLLNPSASLDTHVFPPKIIERFEAVRKDLRATPRCVITAEANIPGARVFVDGRFRGATPVRVEEIFCGEHYLTIRARGCLPHHEMVKVSAGEVAVSVSVQLVPPGQGERVAALAAALGDAPAGDAIPDALSEIGRLLGVDQAIVAVAKRNGDQISVAASVYDLMGRSRIKSGRQTFARYAPSFAGDVDIFTASLYLDIGGKQIATAGAEDEMDSRRAPSGKDKSADAEPFHRKWWFWAGIVLVIGAAVGIPLAVFSGKGSAAPPPEGPAGPPGFEPFGPR